MVTTGQQFLARQTWNPVDVVADTRLPVAAVGMMGAYMARRWAFTSHRNLFGYAVRGADGVVRYAPVDAAGRPIRNAELPGAQLNRVLYNLGTVALGAVVIGQSGDANVDFLALGIAAGGLANVGMALLNID